MKSKLPGIDNNKVIPSRPLILNEMFGEVKSTSDLHYMNELIEIWKEESKHIPPTTKSFIVHNLLSGGYKHLDELELLRLKIISGYEPNTI